MSPIPKKLVPYWTTKDGETVRLYQGDVIEVLRRLPSKSVQCVVTSPPYWALRDYGTGTWEGGDKKCDHVKMYAEDIAKSSTLNCTVENYIFKAQERQFASLCKKCGARRIDRQLGSEDLPDCQAWARGENCAERNWEKGCHVCRMVLVLREVRRVLRDDGTLWINYGDTYATKTYRASRTEDAVSEAVNGTFRIESTTNLPAGNLVGIPWRVALALQADGWILKQDIIWSKPSPMPESVQNRCTKSHEYIFLLVKSKGYYYDNEAVKETVSGLTKSYNSRNKRSVWSVAFEPFEGSHFACFPKKLIEPCILAGTSSRGCCVKCGAPWRRVMSKGSGGAIGRAKLDHTHDAERGNFKTSSSKGYIPGRTLKWQPTCSCGIEEVRPCIVLDPFVGSGTTCCASLGHGRWSWGIELNEKYLKDIAIVRIEGEIMSRPAAAAKLLEGNNEPLALGLEAEENEE